MLILSICSFSLILSSLICEVMSHERLLKARAFNRINRTSPKLRRFKSAEPPVNFEIARRRKDDVSMLALNKITHGHKRPNHCPNII